MAESLSSYLCTAGRRCQCSTAIATVMPLGSRWVALLFVQVGVIIVVVGVPLWAAGGGHCHHVNGVARYRLALSCLCRMQMVISCSMMAVAVHGCHPC